MNQRDAIEAHYAILIRCTYVDDCVTVCLWSGNAIDEATKSRLEAERSVYDRCVRLFEWLKQQTVEVYEQFLRVMVSAEQQHVSNLLRNCLKDSHVPLSNARYARMRSMAPDLLFMIYNNEELVSSLQKNNALTPADYEELRLDRSNCKKNSILVNAILRRSEHSFERLQDALRETRQGYIADALNEGEIIRVHLETSQPELDRELSDACNNIQLRGSLMDELHNQGIHFIRSKPDHSILVYFYCRKPDHVAKFTELNDSGRLICSLTDSLNVLIKMIKPKQEIPLFVNLRLDDEDVLRIQNFAGLEDWMRDRFQGRKSAPSTGLHYRAQDEKVTEPPSTAKGGPGSKLKGRFRIFKLAAEEKTPINEDFEFLTTEVECLKSQERVRELEAELKRKEKEWKEEREELIRRQNEAEQELQRQIALNPNFSSQGKCRDESERQNILQRTI